MLAKNKEVGDALDDSRKRNRGALSSLYHDGSNEYSMGPTIEMMARGIIATNIPPAGTG
jgi:hypothetical protein